MLRVKLNSHTWVRKKINQDWFGFQEKSYELFRNTKHYMIHYISSHKKRRPSSGKLEKVIQRSSYFKQGQAECSFGIGDIAELNSKFPGWYVLNYGKKITGERFIPGGGQYRPVKFGSSNPDSKLGGTGKGTQKATGFMRSDKPVSFINPINYIDSSIHQFRSWLKNIIPKRG